MDQQQHSKQSCPSSPSSQVKYCGIFRQCRIWKKYVLKVTKRKHKTLWAAIDGMHFFILHIKINNLDWVSKQQMYNKRFICLTAVLLWYHLHTLNWSNVTVHYVFMPSWSPSKSLCKYFVSDRNGKRGTCCHVLTVWFSQYIKNKRSECLWQWWKSRSLLHVIQQTWGQ